MPEEINNQEQAERRSGLWISLAIGLLLLVALVALGGCSKNSANSSSTANSNTTPGPGTVVKNNSGMEFAYVPAGNFQMGSDKGTSQERPIHQVTFARGFYMGRYEVTIAQWQSMMGNNPSSVPDCGGDCPVDNVSWNDAQEFINKLNAKNDGYTYRLPSEAEWEYACRAGTTGEFAGDFDAMAWNYANANNTWHPVGKKKPNAWGLYDMHGNVAEWVMDVYHMDYNDAPTDGSAWLSGGVSDRRMNRGGNYFFNEPHSNSSSVRSYEDPGKGRDGIGFRVAAVSRS